MGSRRNCDAALDSQARPADLRVSASAPVSGRVAKLTQLIESVMASPESRAELRDLVAMLAAQQIRGLSLLVEQPAQPQAAQLLTVEDAAQILGIDKRALYRKAHSLSCTRRIGGLLRFDRMELLREFNVGGK